MEKVNGKINHPIVITSKQFINRKKINYKYVIMAINI